MHLNHFKNEEALLLVTGKQDAVIYRASHGILEKVDSFKIPRPHYSDHEGTAATPHELRDKDIFRDFTHELMSHLKNISATTYSTVYVFTPSNVKNQLWKAFPTAFRDKIMRVIEGNYFHFAPIDLLAKIPA